MVDCSPLDLISTKMATVLKDNDWPEHSFLRTIAIVVEIDTGDRTLITSHCSDDRPWTKAAFLYKAADIADMDAQPTGPDED